MFARSSTIFSDAQKCAACDWYEPVTCCACPLPIGSRTRDQYTGKPLVRFAPSAKLPSALCLSVAYYSSSCVVVLIIHFVHFQKSTDDGVDAESLSVLTFHHESCLLLEFTPRKIRNLLDLFNYSMRLRNGRSEIHTERKVPKLRAST